MNVSIFSQMDYENKSNWTLGENKPNSNPIKPNLPEGKIDARCVVTKDYREKDDFAVQKNKPNSNPISEKPKMNVTSFITKDYNNEQRTMNNERSCKTNPIKPNFKSKKNAAFPGKLDSCFV